MLKVEEAYKRKGYTRSVNNNDNDNDNDNVNSNSNHNNNNNNNNIKLNFIGDTWILQF